jgi:hypothetical protein
METYKIRLDKLYVKGFIDDPDGIFCGGQNKGFHQKNLGYADTLVFVSDPEDAMTILGYRNLKSVLDVVRPHFYLFFKKSLKQTGGSPII